MTTTNEQGQGRSGQGAALGDTGDGNTGVPGDEQGISNRPGDRAASAGPDDESVGDASEGEEDDDDDDDVDGDELTDDDDDDVDDVSDPQSEPGKPI